MRLGAHESADAGPMPSADRAPIRQTGGSHARARRNDGRREDYRADCGR
jgi:hypothetical protein